MAKNLPLLVHHQSSLLRDAEETQDLVLQDQGLQPGGFSSYTCHWGWERPVCATCPRLVTPWLLLLLLPLRCCHHLGSVLGSPRTNWHGHWRLQPFLQLSHWLWESSPPPTYFSPLLFASFRTVTCFQDSFYPWVKLSILGPLWEQNGVAWAEGTCCPCNLSISSF